jgi:hypothetical protein
MASVQRLFLKETTGGRSSQSPIRIFMTVSRAWVFWVEMWQFGLRKALSAFIGATARLSN